MVASTTSASSAKPVIFASEEEIPPWLRGRSSLSPIRGGEVAAATERSPGFRLVEEDKEDEEDDHVHDVEWILEATDLHYRLRELYQACRPSAYSQTTAAEERFLRAFIEEPLMVDYLEWQPRITQFLLRRIGYWERTSASGTVRRMASLVLKAFFLRTSDWEV